MTVYFGGKSALEFWRAGNRRSPRTDTSRVTRPLTCPEATKKAVIGTSPWRHGIETAPYELLVTEQRTRNSTKLVKTRLWKWEGAFAQVDEDVFVAMPEDLCMQLSARMTLPELLLLLSEMLGSYSLGSGSGDVSYDVFPATTVDRLEARLAGMGSFHGKALVRRALGIVMPHAASPAEAMLALILTMPKRLGGFGLSKPRLNPRDVLSVRSGRSFVPDLWWEREKLDVEYFGGDHADKQRMLRDSDRRNDIVQTGVTFYVATKRHLYSREGMEDLAEKVSGALGSGPVDMSPQARARRWSLQHALLSALPPAQTPTSPGASSI